MKNTISGYDDKTIFPLMNTTGLITYFNSVRFQNLPPKYPENKKESKELANSLDENDNPVLMLVKLKE